MSGATCNPLDTPARRGYPRLSPMRGALALLRLELASRVRILVAAAVAGLIPPLAALPWVLGRHGSDDVRSVLGTVLLVLAPTLLLTPRDAFLAVLRLPNLATLTTLILAAAVTLVSCSHTVGLMLRIRSRWLLVDLAGFPLVLAATMPFLWHLTVLGAHRTALILCGGLGVSLVVGTILAGLAQTAGGRCDLARGRRLLSTTLWSVVACSAMVVAVITQLTSRVGADGLVTIVTVSSGEAGDWAVVGGMARRLPWLEAAPGMWLVNTQDGRSPEMDVWSWWESTTLWSRSGDRAVVFGTGAPTVWNAIEELVGRPGVQAPDLVAHTVELTRTEPAVTPWPTGSGWIRYLDHSPDLRRIALHREGAIEVYELDGWTRVARVPVEDRGDRLSLIAGFVGERRLLAFVGTSETSCQRLDIALTGNHEVRAEEIAGVALDEIAAVDEGSGRVLVLHLERSNARSECGCTQSWRLYDSTLDTVLAQITVDPAAWNTETAFLSDGRLVVSTVTRSQPALDVFETGGEWRSSLRVTTDGQPQLAGEPRPGLLLVWQLGSTGSTVVDLETGDTRDLEPWPSRMRGGWAQRSTLPRGRAACLMVSPDRSTLLELDPDTLTLTPLLGEGATARWERGSRRGAHGLPSGSGSRRQPSTEPGDPATIAP